MTDGKSKLWFENALLIAVVGAIIGQLASTIIPIMYGPQDVSDFVISVEPVGCELLLFPENNAFASYPSVWHVNVEDINHLLRPYRSDVYLRAFEVPKGITLKFNSSEIKPSEIKPNEMPQIKLKATSDVFSLKDGEYPIVIQGMGGDGRRRNTTFILNVTRSNYSEYMKKTNLP